MDYVGKTIRIVRMEGEPMYSGRIGVVKYVDSIGQLHGTWGGLALQPDTDEFEVVEGGGIFDGGRKKGD